MMTDIILFLDVYEPLKFLLYVLLTYRAVRELNVAAFVTFDMVYSLITGFECVCLYV